MNFKDEWPTWAIMAAIIIALAIIIPWAVNSSNDAQAKCETNGGEYVVDYYMPVLVGKVIVNSPVYECVTQ